MQINVLEYFEKGALRHCPDKVGFSDPHDTFTFRVIERHAKCIATNILHRKDVLNQPVAVFLPKCTKTLVADLGILYSGNFYMNLDDQAPTNRIRCILDNIDPLFIITQRDKAEVLMSIGYPADRLLFVEDLFDIRLSMNNEQLLKRLDLLIDTDPVCIINTSGSTGMPKSVVLSHRGLIDFINWWDKKFDFGQHEIVGSLSPFFFDGYIVGFLMTLLKGARVEILPGELAVFPAKLVQYMAEKKVTFIFWVPSVMVNIANFKIFDKIPLPDLKTVCFAGEVFPTKYLNYWRRLLTNATFINLYGPIEISVICTYYVVDREFRDDEPLPIGYACHNTDILILNDENKTCAINEHGELCVRGSSVALGYWNNSESTGRSFVQNPLNKHYPELIYRTGDVVYLNDQGEIMFVGRKDFQIKHLGYRIELGEIEHAALQVKDIQNCCVIYHQERKEIVFFYESNKSLTSIDIRTQLAAFLPKYMLPTVFNHMEQLPRNPNGKIDRQQLTKLT